MASNNIWETLRLRRYKTMIITIPALPHCGYDDHENAADDLARGWFENKKAKTQIATLLCKFGLAEEAVEAEAFRLCSEDLERLDRMLALAEVRRDKALRFIAEYRQVLSKQLRVAGDRILDNDEVPRLVAVAKRSD